MSEHTPGPWGPHVHAYDMIHGPHPEGNEGDPYGRPFVALARGDVKSGERRANALLIAESPAMAKLLDGWLNGWGPEMSDLESLRALAQLQKDTRAVLARIHGKETP